MSSGDNKIINSLGTRPPSKTQVKKIVSTMESVINSVEKNRRSKRKKRAQLEPEISNISTILSCSLSLISPNVSQENVVDPNNDPEKQKLPLNWKNHLLSSAKQCGSKENTPTNTTTDSMENLKIQFLEEHSADAATVLASSTKNAFDIMMNSRNRSIGMNSPGKELMNVDTQANSSDKKKRKLILEEWAQRKGGLKRKLEEDASEKYIERQLNKRTKRFKQLISNGEKRKNTNLNDSKMEPDNSLDCCIIETNQADEQKCKENIPRRSKKNPKTAKISADFCEKSNAELKTIEKQTTEDDASFLSVLSSPIKKRDSLYSYFSRSEREDETPTTSKGIIKSRKSELKVTKTKKLKTTLEHVKVNGIQAERESTPPPPVTSPSVTTSSNGRPKRECRNKPINYEVDFKLSPEKVASKKILKRARRQQLSSESPNRKSSPQIERQSKHNTAAVLLKANCAAKLAPIFVKSLPKPLVDPAVSKARQEFLMSGIPDCMKLEIEKQRLYEESYDQELEYFPTVSHVQQSNNEICMERTETFNIDFRAEDTASSSQEWSQFICGTPTARICIKTYQQRSVDDEQRSEDDQQQSEDDPQKCVTDQHKIKKDHSIESMDRRKIIKMVKENDDSAFPFFRCYKQLRGKHEDDLLNNSLDDIDLENGSKMFTEKYKAMNSEEIIVNYEPINELKEFLITWQNSANGIIRNYNSDDDFDIGESNSNSCFTMGSAIANVVVLYGPYGCGKTNAVYAIANELHFKVLELNGGFLRTGKNIMRKLQEATQSHQVKNNKTEKTADFYNGKLSGKSMDDNGDSGVVSGEDTQSFSLILIEDADIYFDEDIGYVDAINQLVGTSKRPVILLANQKNCSHLSRFIKQNAIRFPEADSLAIGKWMSTLSIVERCYIPEDDCRRLYELNNFDIRRTMLELQFYIQSGGDLHPSKEKCRKDLPDNLSAYTNIGLFEFFRKNYKHTSVEPDLEGHIHVSTLKRKSKDNAECNTSIDSTGEILKNIVSVDYLNSKSINYEFQSTLSRDIAEEMSYLMTKKSQTKDFSFINGKPDIPQLLSQNISCETRQRTMCMDYEPFVRSICRTENVRKKCERRGRTRFYHYLRNFSTFCGSGDCSHGFKEASKIFQSDLNTETNEPIVDGMA